MKPDHADIVVFGAHPDDIEFGCGGIVLAERAAGRTVHLVICSRGEAATTGTPAERVAEAEAAALLLGATVEFLDLEGDAHLEPGVKHALRLAGVLRQWRPGVVLTPTLEENQHPDHAALGRLVRDAARLARFGGLVELRGMRPHAIEALFFYAITPGGEPQGMMPLLVDVSPHVKQWEAAMRCHGSQMKTRDYVELQLSRARVHGLMARVEYAQQVFANDPPVVNSLKALGRSARHF